MAKDLGTIEKRERVTIRFAGDSGDGIQLTGTQFTHTSAIAGNDLATFPTFLPKLELPPVLWQEFQVFRFTFLPRLSLLMVTHQMF